MLPCSLRYIDGEAYLYYDITSRQNIAQLFEKKPITRQWIMDFLWSMRRVRQEMSRFLLEESNIVWFPQHVYQDLEKKEFLNSFVERVDIYEQEQPDGRFLKHIKFRFPVYFGDRETQELCWDNESTVETVCLLSKKP